MLERGLIVSFVFGAVVLNKGAYLIGDKRVCQKVNGVITPIHDTIHKLFRVDKNIMIGFAGIMPLDTKLFSLVQEILEMGINTPFDMACNIAGHFNTIKNEKNPEQLSIIVAGIEENGSPAMFLLDGFHDYRIYERFTSSKTPYAFWAIGVGGNVEKEQFENDIHNILSNPEDDLFEANLLSRVDHHIELVSQVENGVSPNTDHIIIRNEHTHVIPL